MLFLLPRPCFYRGYCFLLRLMLDRYTVHRSLRFLDLLHFL
nr:MAG TPA: hypothetical protein [Caudoviricetes sp.]